jgi:hypothetical protein
MPDLSDTAQRTLHLYCTVCGHEHAVHLPAFTGRHVITLLLGILECRECGCCAWEECEPEDNEGADA